MIKKMSYQKNNIGLTIEIPVWNVTGVITAQRAASNDDDIEFLVAAKPDDKSPRWYRFPVIDGTIPESQATIS